MDTSIRGVTVVNWNPRRHLGAGRLARALPRLRRPNNFGDLIGPLIVRELASSLPRSRRTAPADPSPRLLAVGSILHMAGSGDTVWGTGRNGKQSDDAHRFTGLDVRAVRGPRTRAWLAERGIDAPPIYGDPALLVPRVFRTFTDSVRPRTRGITIAPNLHDAPRWRDADGFLDPTGRVWQVIRTLAESSHVVASSLHGIIIAEAFGVPASLLLPGAEDLFKYHDYFEGTGRSLPHVSSTVDEALQHPAPPLISTTADALLDAFPSDLWVRHER